MVALNIFHILLHIFEVFMIFICIGCLGKISDDNDALKGWIEIGMQLDLDRLKENSEKFNKEQEEKDT